MLGETIESQQSLTTPDLPAALAYVRSRQTPEGGFSFYRSQGVEEPAAADTFFALTALSDAGVEPERSDDCLRWLLDRQRADGGYSSIATAWYVNKSLECLSAQPRQSPAAWLAPYSERFFDGTQGLSDAHEFLLNLLRYVELSASFGLDIEPRHRNALVASLKRLEDGDGAFPTSGATLPDSAIALHLMRGAGLIAGRRILEFAHSCEDATYGFRAARVGQSTSIEVLAAGVAILTSFHAAPAYPSALLSTVTACQHVNGGFGHRTGALPTLRNTYLALFIIKSVESI